ncbi:helicase-exonuclease AddAB subunit AddB [Paenibacillus oralis]|uniref:ATP-dependent helicase/deoxyribonuclease subunit B n=1 Tax=Paenibacillus oralis TaxID=2490856 RepID=A0A3P3TB03_9BACL|nr:helicase-exonuclease AddAB subunit AddB [Paenibacillus oralis]RRJ54709.1 helicase-exonuclease AddAB subunit AddB [Paenibacillus oralis]
MAIKFIIGRAGSGKTEKCLNEFRQKLLESPSGDPLILLVPEQATFQAEHALVTTPGLRGLLRGQVLSFRRLAWRVMQETGNTIGNPIDDTGKKMLLMWILQQKQEELRLFHASAEKMGFIDNLNSLMSELGRYCLTPDMLKTQLENMVSDTADEVVLEHKLHDLHLVYREFETQLATKYLDAEAYLSHLANQLQFSSLAKGAELWIDGFYGFTPQELEVVLQAMLHFKNVTITLCLNRPYESDEEPNELDLFYPTAMTMIRIQKKIEQLGLSPAIYELLTDHPRFTDRPMLAHLEQMYEQRLSGRRVAYDQPGDEITIYSAANRRAEVEGAAREIIKMVRLDGLRYRDIAVRVRNIEEYGDLIATTFKDYDIPFFLDQKRTVLHHPLVEFIRSALEVILNNWRFDSVFRCIKTDLLLPLVDGKLPRKNSRRIARNEMDELENLVLAYGIQGTRWNDTKNWSFTRYRSIDDAVPDEADPVFSKRMDHCRRTVARPLKALQKRMKDAVCVRDMIEALYLLLEEAQVAERLQRWSEVALLNGRPEKSKEHAQIFDNIIDMFDQMVDILGDENATPELFRKLVETGLESIRQGLVPPALDQVLIGSIDRTRSAQVAVAMVLGVNDGVLPQAMSESGIITEAEREALTNRGLQLADGARRKLMDEQFLIYTVLCSPSKRLWLSYPLADEEGMTLLSSEVIKHTKMLFPYAKSSQLHSEPESTMSESEQASYISTPSKTISYLLVQLKQWMRGESLSDIWFDVYNWYLKHPEWNKKLAILTGALAYTNEEKPLPAFTSRLLYGDQLVSSVSRMELFVACPFSHFALNGLKLKERKVFRLEAPDIGELYHAALSNLFKELQEKKITLGSLNREELLSKTSEIVERLTPRLQNEILTSSHRHRHIARKLTNVLQSSALALHEHDKRGVFHPVGLELAFGPNEQLPALQIDLQDGRIMEVIGRIDRIDVAQLENDSLLRIIDYKSSAKSLELDEVFHGLSLQTLTYLDVAISNSEKWLGMKTSPAGVLYFHVHNPMISNSNPLTEDSVVKEKRKSFKMSGLVLADHEVVRMMDSEVQTGHSELIPVGLKKDGGFYSNSSIASAPQWDKLSQHVRETIGKIGMEIVNGKVDISPCRTSKKTACDYCPIKPVCKFDSQFEGNNHNVLKGMSNDEVWQALYSKRTEETD